MISSETPGAVFKGAKPGSAVEQQGNQLAADRAATAKPSLGPTIAVVIPTYNHAHFLGEALRSVLDQTIPATEIIVVDDGSEDDPAGVVRAFEGVQLVRQSNQGLSAARNAGLRAARSEMIVFLDADDRLLPNAIAAGLACHARLGECALVYGGHQHISSAGDPSGSHVYNEIGPAPYLALLEFNLIGMHGAVMYRRKALLEVGGFDVTLPCCEDYDVYLKLARRSRIACYPEIVAEYRKHPGNMSSKHLRMLHWALTVQARNIEDLRDPTVERISRLGRARLRSYYAREILLSAGLHSDGVGGWIVTFARAVRASPRYVAGATLRKVLRRLPPPVEARLRRLRDRSPPLGRVNFGDFERTDPIDNNFGFGRGTPVDRFYIELFLHANRKDIAGRVLEVADDSYSRRFGGSNIVRQDILHAHSGNPRATIVGDLTAKGVLPENSFDCIVLTQTLQFVFDLPRAIAGLHDALRPGGVLLLTVPGISQLERGEWSGSWYWALTPASAARLFAENFPGAELTIESHGNVFAATALLQGVALEELPRAKLTIRDPAYPLVVTVRARRLT